MTPRLTDDHIRQLLLDLGEVVRAAVDVAVTSTVLDDELAAVVAEGEDDTIFGIDVIAERVALAWLEEVWPADHPVDVVMEGHRSEPVDGAIATLVVDPIDGTRGLMHDKRSAWFLAGYAPRPRPARLQDLTVASMSELPTSRQRLADDWSAIAGRGPSGVHGRRVALGGGVIEPLHARPYAGITIDQQWASVAMFLPAGMRELADFSATLFAELGDPVVFHDQYLASGGQLHELLTGRDVLVVDARSLLGAHLAPHPYDVSVSLIASEAGCVITDLDGAPLDSLLDTTSSVGWIGVANPALAEVVLPVIQRSLDSTLRRGPAR